MTGTAVVHEWIDSRAGSEKVFEAIAGLLPGADLWALTCEPHVPLDLGGRRVRTTVLDRQFLRRRRAALLPLMPLAWRAGRSKEYDLVVSSHHAFAKSVRFGRDAMHLCYVHTPARYLWSPELDGRGEIWAFTPCGMALRRLDRRHADHVDAFAANSSETARRISKCWGRSARVIHPPVDVERFAPPSGTTTSPSAYLLGVGRFIAYKRLDLVIETAERVGLPAVLAGHGPLEGSLRAAAARARVPVTVVTRPTDQELESLYRGATALVFPAHEDFGIVPVEAQACGTPVVGLAAGGTLDTVVPGLTGALVEAQDPDLLASAVEQAVGLSPSACRRQAEKFSAARFAQEMLLWLGSYSPVPLEGQTIPGSVDVACH